MASHALDGWKHSCLSTLSLQTIMFAVTRLAEMASGSQIEEEILQYCCSEIEETWLHTGFLSLASVHMKAWQGMVKNNHTLSQEYGQSMKVCGKNAAS